MRLTYSCQNCGATNGVELTATTTAECSACHHTTTLSCQLSDHRPTHCAACGCSELYRQKDFPQWLGLGLLTVACLLFFVFAIRYEYTVAWSVLLGSAAIDGLIYFIVGDVVICYRCGAKHRGVVTRAFGPFELTVAEKYRQERLRREQLTHKQ